MEGDLLEIIFGFFINLFNLDGEISTFKETLYCIFQSLCVNEDTINNNFYERFYNVFPLSGDVALWYLISTLLTLIVFAFLIVLLFKLFKWIFTLVFKLFRA